MLVCKICQTAFYSRLISQISALMMFLFANFRFFNVSSNKMFYVEAIVLKVINYDFSQLCERISLNFLW